MRIIQRKLKIIAQLQNPKYSLILDSQDTDRIKEELPEARDYDGFLVSVKDGDYEEVWAFTGYMPLLSKIASQIK